METTSLLKSLPAAFCIALFRPWITDIHGNKMILISVIENIFILITMLLFLLKAKRKPIDSFIILTIFFVVLMYSLIGITTPVLGALVRYKIAALPFIYFLLIYFSDTEKLNSMIYKKLNRN